MSAPQTQPAFRQMGDRFSGTGLYGTCAYGTAPYGGHAFPPYYLPKIHIPSDALSCKRRHKVIEITKRRNGAVIGNRVEVILGVWRVRLHATPEDAIDELSAFHTARRFYLLPSGEDGGVEYPVFWTNPEFKPVPVPGSPGRFTIEFEIEEIPS